MFSDSNTPAHLSQTHVHKERMFWSQFTFHWTVSLLDEEGQAGRDNFVISFIYDTWTGDVSVGAAGTLVV